MTERFTTRNGVFYTDTKTGYEFECYGEVADMMNELAEKNEQLIKEIYELKKENYELHKRLGDFESFERYMKERTSKTSLEDIIGIVKTDEPTNSVELKKELYK